MRPVAVALLALSLSASAGAADDTAAPIIDHQPVKYTEKGAKFVQVFAKIIDDSKIFPQTFYRYGPGEYQKPIDMKAVKGQKDQWGANIPVKGDLVEYYIEAYDELGNGPGRSADPDHPYRVDTSGQGGMQVAEAPAPKPAPRAAPPPVWNPQPAAPPPPAAPMRQPVAARSSGRVWTWVVGGVGVGALAGGLIAGNEMKTADKVYTEQLLTSPGASYSALKAQYDANKSLGQKATILTVAGAVLIAAGVVLYFVEGSSSSQGSGGGGDVGVLHF